MNLTNFKIRHFTLILLFVSTLVQAQKIKVKKGDVFLDGNKVASIEKQKAKGANNYLKIFNNEKKHLFNAKLVSELSPFFDTNKISNYFIIECLEQKDSIGIEKLTFYLGEKQVVKYLTQKGILSLDGFNTSKVESLLSETESRPSFAREKYNSDLELIKNVNYLVDRDTSDPLFIEEKSTTTAPSIINGISILQTKYKIFQGKDKSNNILIGYAYIEKPEIGAVKLIIVNSKGTPIGYKNSFNYFTFYPLTDLDIDSTNKKNTDTPVKSIQHFTRLLINANKI